MKPLFDGAEWDFPTIERTWEAIDKIAKETFKLDYYPVQIEMITSEQMLDAYSSHAMPMFYNHWSFGKSFLKNFEAYKKGHQGLAYEVVINTDPCIAYLMEDNSMTMQALVLAHASAGHNSFFKNNYMFKDWTDAKFIVPYLKYAKEYIQKAEGTLGVDVVEQILDACHALQYHGVFKYRRRKKKKGELLERKANKLKYQEENFNDLWRTLPAKSELREALRDIVRELNDPELMNTSKAKIPEENLLYFIEKNAENLDEEAREIIRIVRNIAQYFYPQMQTKLMNEGWACYEENTEFLSQHGWKKIKDYQEGDLVAQYHANGTIDFVAPLEYVKYEEAPLLHIQASGVDQKVTPNHRMIYRSSRGHINECRADELTTSVSRQFINRGNITGTPGVPYSEQELRLITAVIADGSYNPNTSTTYCQVGLKKKRKKSRLRSLLNDLGIKYKETNYTQGRTSFSFYTRERLKEFPQNFYQCTRRQLEIILEEALHWDGHISTSGREIYYSTNKSNMDFIQFALSVTNSKAKLSERKAPGPNRSTLYVVERLKSKNSTLSNGTIRKLEGNHDVYCFRVPSGMLVTRQNDVVNVSGNTFMHYEIMTEMEQKGLITEGSYLEFLRSHSGVVAQPGFDSPYFSGINVYALGFAMFRDLKRLILKPTEEDRYWFPDIAGKGDWINILQEIAYNFRDESFVLQWLSPKVIRDMKLFCFSDIEGDRYYRITEVATDDDIENLRSRLSDQYNIGLQIPNIEVVDYDQFDTRTITLRHTRWNNIPLDDDQTHKVADYMEFLWGYDVDIETSQ